MRLFDFSSSEARDGWRVINDSVMGGLSHALLQPAAENTEFSGMISLQNNGGFALVRSAELHYDLSDAGGLRLRCRGDGKSYKLCLRLEKSFDGISWQSRFDSSAGNWEDIDLPFDTFKPTWHGRPVPHSPPFEAGHIKTLDLLIGDRQAGPFHLQLAWIDALPSGDAA